jgi:hypothetical protein
MMVISLLPTRYLMGNHLLAEPWARSLNRKLALLLGALAAPLPRVLR